jgi:hypothetical protein
MKEMQASKAASQLIEGLDYPANKSAILAIARDASVDPTVLASLEKLPGREYSDAEDLTQALNAS